MGKDRQESKMRASGKVPSDRDQALGNKGASKMTGPKEARDLNNNKL